MSSPESCIEQLVATARQFHTLPTVAMEVLELTSNPKVDTRALKDCIENDPALTARLLRVVNSSLFGLAREVSDLNQALALLGTKPLKLLVLGFSLPSGLFEGIRAETLAAYWRHTLTKAVAAREISESIWRQPGDEAFIAGLLQDLAVPLLIQELGEPYVRLLEKTRRAGHDLAPLETQAMGFDHTELTARLLTQWGLPQTLINTIVHVPPNDGQPMPETLRAQRRIVHLAELTARLLADGQTVVLPELLATARQYHAVSEEQLEALVERLEEKVSQLADVLSLQLAGGLDYRDILVRAHGQMSEVAMAAAEDLLCDSASATEREGLAGELESLSHAVADVGSRATVRRSRVDAAAPSVPREPATITAGAAPTIALPSAPPRGVKLLRSLETMVVACRQSRSALSLLLLELRASEDAGRHSPSNAAQQYRGAVESLCREIDHDQATCQPYGECGFAVILADCDRSTAVALGNELVRQFARMAAGPTDVRLAVGAATVALPPRNFPAQDLIDGADRCLYGSLASGGGVVKSIEIY